MVLRTRNRPTRRTRLSATPLEQRCVPASIAGQVFNDLNANGAFDAGESGLPGVTVFLDSNGNGALDNGPTKSYSSTNVPVNIPDNTTVTSTLSVPDVG